MNAPVESKLLPCPFCESEFPPVSSADDNGDTVICTGCSALGPSRRTRDEAITAWNSRTNQVAELVEALQWAFDTLIELNPSNYDHDNVCEVNAAAVEVMLGLKPILASHKGEQP